MPRTQYARAIDAPAPPYTCELIALPVAAIPFALRALEARTVRSVWSSASYKTGVQLIRSMQVALLTGCLDELLASNARLYMLLDSALYGRQYTASADDPPVYTPLIPAAPDTSAQLPGIVARADRMEKLLDNAINGTFYIEYPSNTSIRLEIVRIRELLEEAQSAENQEELLAKLSEIAVLLA